MKNYDELTSKLLSRRDAFVENKKKRTKIVVSATLSCIVLISALSVGIVKGGVFKTTPNGEDNITSDNNSSQTSSQNKKVIYVTGDTADNYAIPGEMLKSLKGRYISPALQEQMDLYKGYTEAEVVYRVVVEIFIAGEDSREADKLADADKEVQSLYEQKVAAYLEEQKAMAEYQAFWDANPEWLANPEKYPEITAESKRMAEIVIAKESIRKELQSKWMNLRDEIRSEYLKQVVAERLEFATQFSEKKPVVTSSYNDYLFYMDLTAEEINILAEKGGYMFKLSSNDYIPGEVDE